MRVFETIAGIFLVIVSLQDQFQSLFHPAGHGVMSDWIARGIWKMYRVMARFRPKLLSMAGPTGMVCIVATWGALITVGMSLIYYPRLAIFASQAGLPQPEHYVTALNIAFAGLTTTNSGFLPLAEWQRMNITLESVFGIAIISAGISWVLSVYPVLEGRSSAAQQAISLADSERDTGIELFTLPASRLCEILLSLAKQLTTIRNQLVQFPIAYYFGVQNEKGSMARAMPYIDGLSTKACEESRPPEVRMAGHMLDLAIQSYLQLIATRFLKISADHRTEIMRRYAEDTFPSRPPVST